MSLPAGMNGAETGQVPATTAAGEKAVGLLNMQMKALQNIKQNIEGGLMAVKEIGGMAGTVSGGDGYANDLIKVPMTELEMLKRNDRRQDEVQLYIVERDIQSTSRNLKLMKLNQKIMKAQYKKNYPEPKVVPLPVTTQVETNDQHALDNRAV